MSEPAKLNIVDGKPVAYTALLHPDAKLYGIGICRQGEPGYHPVPDYGPYKDEEHAKGIAKRLNDRLGVSEQEAWEIVASTMGKSPRSRRGT